VTTRGYPTGKSPPRPLRLESRHLIRTTLSHFSGTARLGEGGTGEDYCAEDIELEVLSAGTTDAGFYYAANLDQLPLSGFTVIALPMKIKGGSGGPLRIVAVLGD